MSYKLILAVETELADVQFMVWVFPALHSSPPLGEVTVKDTVGVVVDVVAVVVVAGVADTAGIAGIATPVPGAGIAGIAGVAGTAVVEVATVEVAV